MRRTVERFDRGATRIELFVILAVLFSFACFLGFNALQIKEVAASHRCMENLKAIGRGLHLYANEEPDRSFPKDNNARGAFRKIFVRGNIIDSRIFDCPSRDGHPAGKPGPFLKSPSQDLEGVEYLYSQADMGLDSVSSGVLVVDRPGNHPGGKKFHVLHVDGRVTEETSMPSGNFA